MTLLSRNESRPTLPLILVLVLLGGAVLFVSLRPSPAERRYGPVVHETRSEYSHIRVREKDRVRSLLFVDPAGAEQCQSSIDLDAPGELELGYTRGMFASHLFRTPQPRVLIVGLGGGGMVRFLQEHQPDTAIEAVEIDPAVVQIAAEWFETHAGPELTVHTADAFAFLREDRGPFDAIYMDAFLRPAAGSGLDEKTLRLKTREFLSEVQARLVDGGVVVFNLIASARETPEDLEAIADSFEHVHRFAVPGTGNVVVIARTDSTPISREDLERRARELEESGGLPIPFSRYLRKMIP